MSNYNTFVVVDIKRRKSMLVTSSARKANKELAVGKKIEVWNGNALAETVYARKRREMNKYIAVEKEYIRKKQEAKTNRRNTYERKEHHDTQRAPMHDI